MTMVEKTKISSEMHYIMYYKNEDDGSKEIINHNREEEGDKVINEDRHLYLEVLEGKCIFTFFTHPSSVIDLSNNEFFLTEGVGLLIIVEEGGIVTIHKGIVCYNEKNTKARKIFKNNIIQLESYFDIVIDSIDKVYRIQKPRIPKLIVPYKRDYSHCFKIYYNDVCNKLKIPLKMNDCLNGNKPIWIEILNGRYCFIYHNKRCEIKFFENYVFSTNGNIRMITLETGSILVLEKENMLINKGNGEIEEINKNYVKMIEDNVTRHIIIYDIVNYIRKINIEEFYFLIK